MRKTSTKSKKAAGVSSYERQLEELLHDLSADPRLVGIVREFKNRAKTASRKFGSNGLKVNGRLFALFTQGTLVVKLPPARVSILVGQGELANPSIRGTDG
jgi:hypothetical protein